MSTAEFLPGNIVENKGRSAAGKICDFTRIFGVRHYDRKRMTTGYNWKDTEYCRSKNNRISNIPKSQKSFSAVSHEIW